MAIAVPEVTWDPTIPIADSEHQHYKGTQKTNRIGFLRVLCDYKIAAAAFEPLLFLSCSAGALIDSISHLR